MSRFMAGQELERIEADAFLPRMQALGISPDHLPRIVDRIPVEMHCSIN
jgi:hypothetical protein